jgi:hypothetical protein
MEPHKVAAIEKFNKVLEKVEHEIIKLAWEYEEEIKAKKPDDYKLDAVLGFSIDENEKGSWNVNMWRCLNDIKNGIYEWGPADGQDHNVAMEKALHGQKHCWLLQLLYDILHLTWDEVLKVNWLWIDFVLCYQYEYSLSGVKALSHFKKRLLKAEEDIISHTFPIRRKAMERVLKGEVCDYNLFLRITFHNKDNVDILEMTKDLKFHNESWKIFRGLDEGNLFKFLKYAFEDLGFDPEKMLTIKKLKANIILKYPHRFYLSKNF